MGFVWAVIRILVWLWSRLPSRAVSIQAEQLDKTLGVLLAIALFPNIAVYGLQVIQSFIIFISGFIPTIGSSLIPPSCNNDAPSCPSDLARAVAMLLGNAATSIVRAMNLSAFPVSSFLWFLLTSVIAAQVIGFVRRESAAGRIGELYLSSSQYVPPVLRQRFAFAVLVID
jgi:hypothetical protein